jgi:hypothetical protein
VTIASRRHLLTFAVASLCAAALSPQSGHAQRGGSRLSADVVLGWRLSAAWSVGGADDSSLFLSTTKAKDIAVLNGTLLIVDRDRSQVARYSSDGFRLASIGRRDGAGPGELSFPRSVAVDPNGRIIVEDWGNGRISYFEASGRFIRNRSHEQRRSISLLRANSDSSLIGLVEMTDSISLAILTDRNLRTIASIRAPRRVSTAPVCSTTGYGMYPLFSPSILFATSGAMLAFVAGDGQVSFFRGDRPHTRHTHAFPRRRTSTAMARAHLGRGVRIQLQGSRPCTVPSAVILDAAEVAPELPAYGSLAIDPDGVVWAMRYAVGKEPALADVFHPERGYLGTVPVGDARPVAFLSRSLLVSLEADEDDVPIVRVYRISRQTP